MSRLLLWGLMLGAAIWLGLYLPEQPGRVIIAVQGKTITMSLGIALLLGVIVFALGYAVLRSLNQLVDIGNWCKGLGQRRQQQQARARTQQGLIQLTEGHWVKAERYLRQSAPLSEAPWLNYLSAARAAQAQGANQRRDHYLALAHQQSKGADMAIGLTQAQLQFSHGQYEQSLMTLQQLNQLAPKHPYVLKLLKKIYMVLGEWELLLKLIPKLKKYAGISGQEGNDLERQAYRERLLAAQTQQTSKAIQGVWKSMPKALHYEPKLLTLYVNALHDYANYPLAEQVLKEALKRNWNPEWIRLYGLTRSETPSQQLALAQHWLKAHPKDPVLLLTLGRLAGRNELWEQAQQYLQHSLKLQLSADALAELGLVYDKLQQPKLSAECFKQGLLLTAAVVPSGLPPATTQSMITGSSTHDTVD
jgi:HemY protein